MFKRLDKVRLKNNPRTPLVVLGVVDNLNGDSFVVVEGPTGTTFEVQPHDIEYSSLPPGFPEWMGQIPAGQKWTLYEMARALTRSGCTVSWRTPFGEQLSQHVEPE